MSAALSCVSWPAVHRQFEATLPQLDRVIRFQFRRWPSRYRAEAIADARAAAWRSWCGLLARGHDPLAVGPTGIAFNACRYVKSGRRLGTGSCGRSAMDVYHGRAQQKRGYRLVSIEREPGEGPECARGVWRDWVSTDNRFTPADAVAFVLDFGAWLGSLPPRRRRVAELLSEGCTTGEVARLVGVSAGAVSQTRTWLRHSWTAFRGTDGVAV
jgi:hypothetical protein